ncbi:MAG: hypothetical protein IMF12_04820 [Proteobacteria bacterium]|nr:hypothetical protein [Pseudomonadota bacterium]
MRNDAPQFANGLEAVKWMDGKVVASPHGACTDRFARLAFQQAAIEPKQYMNQNIQLITKNFKRGKLDAAAIWEPMASKIVKEGLARRAASGEDFDALDGGFMVMLHDLMEQRPDVYEAWLRSELDAQLFMANPDNADEIIAMAKAQTKDIKQEILWHSLYGNYPANQGGGKIKIQLDFIVTERVQKLLNNATQFLYGLRRKPAAEPTIREGGVSICNGSQNFD